MYAKEHCDAPDRLLTRSRLPLGCYLLTLTIPDPAAPSKRARAARRQRSCALRRRRVRPRRLPRAARAFFSLVTILKICPPATSSPISFAITFSNSARSTFCRNSLQTKFELKDVDFFYVVLARRTVVGVFVRVLYNALYVLNSVFLRKLPATSVPPRKA